MPNTLTKQAATSAADSAIIAPAVGTITFRPHCGSSGLTSTAWKVSHSETKAVQGRQCGDGDRACRNANAVTGMR
jgi:hypothetical protein